MPKVYNRHKQATPKEAVFIGRPTKWGNPFVIDDENHRLAVIAGYRRYLQERPDLIEDAKIELAGKDLVCFCAPLPCHGDILLEVANGEPFYTQKQ